MTRKENERGSGLFSSLFGTFAFLIFLMFGAQEALRAYESTTVSALAFDAARAVATSPTDVSMADSTSSAEQTMRSRLGSLGDKANVVWTLDNPDLIQLEVVVPSPRAVPLVSITPSNVTSRAQVKREQLHT